MKPILFLDFDGVINPFVPRLFDVDDPDLCTKLAKEKGNPEIETLGLRFVTQIYHGFDPMACWYIRQLCEEFDAQIIVSSSWRLTFTLTQLKAILDIHDLGHYVLDATPILDARAQEIQTSIQQYRIKNYLVIDDFNMEIVFGKRMIHTQRVFTQEDFLQARRSLKRQTR